MCHRIALQNCLNPFAPPGFDVKWLFWARNHISTFCCFLNEFSYILESRKEAKYRSVEMNSRQVALASRIACAPYVMSIALKLRTLPLWIFANMYWEIIRSIIYHWKKKSDSTLLRCFNAFILRASLQPFNYRNLFTLSIHIADKEYNRCLLVKSVYFRANSISNAVWDIEVTYLV